VKAAIFFRDRNIVDAGFATAHQPVRFELPLLVAVRAMPLSIRIVPLILKAHGDMIAVECPEILDQAIVEFVRPFARQEGDDRRTAFEELGAIAPSDYRSAVASLGRWTASIASRSAFGMR
jgi:hypothetical protein